MKSASRVSISFWVNPAEFEQIAKLQRSTTCRSLSEYIRKLLLAKPVVVKYRSESADQYLEEMIVLKNELNAIGNHFYQAVKRLHTLDTTGEMRSWLTLYESTHQALIRKIEEIKERLNQIYELWSSK